MTLEEKIQLILEGKDPNALQVIPASVDPTITNPVSAEIQPEVTPDTTAPEVEDPTKGESDEKQVEPPVSIENPLSVDPLETEEQDPNAPVPTETKDKVEESAENILEALRLVSKHGEGKHTAKVYKDPEWDEHRVKFYVDGQHNKEADYHTSDVEDAKGTADKETSRLNKLEEGCNKQKEVEESTESLLAADAHLTEEFQAKAKELFQEELAIRTKAIEEEYTTKLAQVIEKLEEEKKEYINTLSEKIDTYLDTISESWVANNKPILESNAQIEISNSFMKKMKDLFEEHNIEVPESKRDIVIEMETKLTEMQSKLDTLTETLQESSVELSKMNKEKVINESMKGMTELDQARMSKLIEDIEYDTEESFGKKIQTLKESVFMKQVPVLNEEKLKVSGQIITEGGSIKTHSPIMQLYIDALQG